MRAATGDTSEHSTVGRVLQRLVQGDESARPALIEHAMNRLTSLARWQLRDFPAVARWEETDDVVQGAARRLHESLRNARPKDSREFYRLCSALIRRELIDLKRRLFGPEGIGANLRSPKPASREQHPVAVDSTNDPEKLARWTELHERISALPDNLREVFELIWYQGLTHREAAAAIGVATKTISRRWREARLRLHHLFDEDDR